MINISRFLSLSFILAASSMAAGSSHHGGPSIPDELRVVIERALVATETKVTAPDGGFFHQFGTSVDIDGDYAVVGAPFADSPTVSNSGAAYVFFRSGGAWGLQAKLTAPSPAGFDQFGNRVAINGSTIVVGAERDDVPAGADAGSAFVFIRSGTTWSLQAQLQAADASFGDNFGSDVAIDGDTTVVGAFLDDDPIQGSNVGSAYVFVRSGTTWTQQAKLSGADLTPNAQLGRTVTIDGDTAAIGAPVQSDIGAAYVFVRSGTVWTQQAKLTPSDGVIVDRFGLGIGLSGDTVLVGAPQHDSTGTDSGSVYVYGRSGTSWSQQVILNASDSGSNKRFGTSVDLEGDFAVIGSPSTSAAGAAYVFTRSGSTWTEVEKVTASDGAASDNFGFASALSGDTILIGAQNANTPSGNFAGAAYFYSPVGVSQTDLSLTKIDSPDPVLSGQNVTYTLQMTNNNANGATNVVVSDNLPADTTFVSCSSDLDGACGGSGNNRSVTFASLAGGATATITLIANVNCATVNGTQITNSASVTSSTNDPLPGNNSATATTTVSNPAPNLTTDVAISSLGPPFNHVLINVGLSASTSDNCGTSNLLVNVFGDEDDAAPTNGAIFSPDATDIAPGTLKLRRERAETENGRVYLIVVKATDSGGGTSFSCETVVVPKSNSPASHADVAAQAAAAKAFCESNAAAAPAGYFIIGD